MPPLSKDRAKQLLEAIDDTLAKMTLRAYRSYRIALETMIARYQREMQETTQAYLPKLLAAYGHKVTLNVVLIDLGASLNKIGERYLRLAADIGFERCLVDLQIAGKITSYSSPVSAPAKLSAQAITENRKYIEESLLPDMLTKMTNAQSTADALASFEHRISLYGHYLWRTSERSFILGLQMFEAARREARSRR